MRRHTIMPRADHVYDLAIVGSGYSGTLMAMVARRLGFSVVLLERGTHPRVAIGESSTPLSNLLLEELARKYNLPRLLPLTKWGSWQQHYPHLACGLKRGFTFHAHVRGQAPAASKGRSDQLLVAASPSDWIADTHWYRADVDAFLLQEAQALGAEYFDHVRLARFIPGEDVQVLEGTRTDTAVKYHCRFVIDASGPRGFLYRALGLREALLPGALPTQALYSHFSGVSRLEHSPFARTEEQPPYPIDDAAVHHVFDGGWVWVLQFNNGVTSAGVVATDPVAEELGLATAECGSISEEASSGRKQAVWARLLGQLPALQQQFHNATPLQPFSWLPRLSFCSDTIAGDNWAMLPSAAGFVDPLLSTGFPLTLLGIERLSNTLAHHWGKASLGANLQNYAARTQAELAATSELIGSLYATRGDFPRFAGLSLLYFAAASFTETARRLHRPELASSFLLHDHSTFGPASRRIYEGVLTKKANDGDRFLQQVMSAIAPIDIAGLSDLSRNNWYPARAEDLLHGADKLGVSRREIMTMLARCGFAMEADAADTRNQQGLDL